MNATRHSLTPPLPTTTTPIRWVLLASLAGLSWSPGRIEAQDQGRALAIEDYYSIRSINSPVISPGGEWVAYALESPIEEDNSSATEVWVAATDGDPAPRRISPAGVQAFAPSWGPDGLLRYVSGDNAYSIRPDAPPASREVLRRDALNDIPAPRGALVASLVTVPPPEAVPTHTSDFERRHEERFDGRAWDWMYFQRDRQPMPTLDPTDPRATPPREITIADSEGAPRRILTELGLRPSSLTWRPDGEALVFAADSAYRDEWTYGRNDLWAVTIDGEVRRLTWDLRYTLSQPAYSPEGSRIAYVNRYATDWVIGERLGHGGPTDLMVLDVSSGEHRNITADWDLRPGQPRWSPDGRHVYFTAGIGGEAHLFRAATDGSGVEQVTRGERRLTSLTMDERRSKIAYLVGRFDAPSELFVADIDGGGERQLTHVHDRLRGEVAFSAAERIRFASYDGTEIEGWVMFPYGYDPTAGPYPLIVHSHGGPHSASGYGLNFKHQLFAANGYFVLQTNFRSSTGYGEDFLWATWGAWGDKDGEDVMSGVDHVLANYPIDRGRVAAIGHSYGGFMSNWLITRYPDRFAAAAVGAGISNWLSDYGTADVARTKETEFFGTPWTEEGRERLIRQSPLIYADRARAATLFVHGEVDHRVPFEEGEQMYFALKKNRVPAKFLLYNNQPHGIGGHWNRVHRAMHELRWFDRYLKPRDMS